MVWTQNDVATLKAAIATGALEVTFGAGPDQRTVKYRSLADMRATLDMVAAEAAGAAPVRVSYVAHSRE
ncbi:hypothetical protein RA307_09865 [Xanthobacteraceae bacterium Astr-EGSB]|uniref:phage head-tail joining protein n=1 Tax=Astrobacterium formosum TaxID=3069710 RepID=UPI0027B18F41|nr:hypothetical protein [Xanthobacteraceae bacterium Astr-EGSB]